MANLRSASDRDMKKFVPYSGSVELKIDFQNDLVEAGKNAKNIDGQTVVKDFPLDFFEELTNQGHQLIVGDFISRGTFSNVYEAFLYKNDSVRQEKCALKACVPTSDPVRTLDEIRILRKFGGQNNLIQLLCMQRIHDRLFLLLEFVDHTPFQDWFFDAQIVEIREYLRNLFIALNFLHQHSIIHRDVKPSNFLYDRKAKIYRLIDFGLVEIQRDFNEILPNSSNYSIIEMENSPPKKRPRLVCSCSEVFESRICKECTKKPRCRANCAGTGGYRAFEVLLRVRHQTTAVDIWSCGVICLCFAAGKFPFFNAIKNDLEGLAELASIFGTDKIIQAAAKLGKKFVSSEKLPGYDLYEFCAQVSQSQSISVDRCQISGTQSIIGSQFHIGAAGTDLKIRPESFQIGSELKIRPEMKIGAADAGSSNEKEILPRIFYELLDSLLTLDPEQRISASDALMHPFFISP